MKLGPTRAVLRPCVLISGLLRCAFAIWRLLLASFPTRAVYLRPTVDYVIFLQYQAILSHIRRYFTALGIDQIPTNKQLYKVCAISSENAPKGKARTSPSRQDCGHSCLTACLLCLTPSHWTVNQVNLNVQHLHK